MQGHGVPLSHYIAPQEAQVQLVAQQPQDSLPTYQYPPPPKEKGKGKGDRDKDLPLHPQGPGDWFCGNCGYLCFKRSTECRRCGHPKGDDSVVVESETAVKRKFEEMNRPPGSDHFTWCDLPPTSPLPLEGFPVRAPVVPFNRDKQAFSSAHGMLIGLVDGDVEAVELEHDLCNPEVAESQFPDIKDALDICCGQADPFCVARCRRLGLWAVGTSHNWKEREKAAKLALAISIAINRNRLGESCTNDLAFAEFVKQAGLLEGREEQAIIPVMPGSSALKWPMLGLNLRQQSSLTDRGMSAQAPGVYYDKEFQECFNNAGTLLGDIMGAAVAKVTYVHDTDFVQFPCVKRAIIESGGEPDCFTIATDPTHNKWGVGIAPGWKNREKAAKVALALALADEESVFDKCIYNYPDFAKLCVKAELINEEKIWKASKKQKAAIWNSWNSSNWGKGGSSWDNASGSWGNANGTNTWSNGSWSAGSKASGGDGGKGSCEDWSNWTPEAMQAMMNSMWASMDGGGVGGGGGGGCQLSQQW